MAELYVTKVSLVMDATIITFKSINIILSLLMFGLALFGAVFYKLRSSKQIIEQFGFERALQMRMAGVAMCALQVYLIGKKLNVGLEFKGLLFWLLIGGAGVFLAYVWHITFRAARDIQVTLK